jgi:hypothetical protein
VPNAATSAAWRMPQQRHERHQGGGHGRPNPTEAPATAFAYPLEVDLLFFDTTSTYFERDEEDGGADAFRRLGHSKDHR